MKSITIAIYGEFEKKELKVKVLRGGSNQFTFQSVLRKAGYDCELHTIDIEEDLNSVEE